MSFRVVVAGRPIPTGLLTIGDLDALQSGDPRRMLVVLTGLGVTSPDNVRTADITFDEDELPCLFENGLPVEGRLSDRYVALFGQPPWCWPPSVTRGQTVRDLELIVLAMESRDG